MTDRPPAGASTGTRQRSDRIPLQPGPAGGQALTAQAKAMHVGALDGIAASTSDEERRRYLALAELAMSMVIRVADRTRSFNAALVGELDRVTHESAFGGYNKAGFYKAVENLRANAIDPVFVVAADLANFKRLNELFLHAGGDVFLRAVAQAELPDNILRGHFSGDEFAFAFQARDLADAQRIMDGVTDLIFAKVVEEVTTQIVWSYVTEELRGDTDPEAVKRAQANAFRRFDEELRNEARLSGASTSITANETALRLVRSVFGISRGVVEVRRTDDVRARYDNAEREAKVDKAASMLCDARASFERLQAKHGIEPTARQVAIQNDVHSFIDDMTWYSGAEAWKQMSPWLADQLGEKATWSLEDALTIQPELVWNAGVFVGARREFGLFSATETVPSETRSAMSGASGERDAKGRTAQDRLRMVDAMTELFMDRARRDPLERPTDVSVFGMSHVGGGYMRELPNRPADLSLVMTDRPRRDRIDGYATSFVSDAREPRAVGSAQALEAGFS